MPSDNAKTLSQKKVPLWRQPAVRSIIFQVLLVLCIVAFGNFLLSNTLHNLEQRGITTGFAFCRMRPDSAFCRA